MKIAVVGCGAVGSFYGACLARSGQDVHFLPRSDYDVVRRDGVCIRSPQGDFRAHPKCAQSPNEIGVADLAIVALKTTANDAFARLLPPLVGPETAVLTLQNGLGNEECLARLFPAEQILGGLCFVCLNRIQPGVIQHLAHGQVVLGEFQRPPEARTEAIAAMLRSAGVSCVVAPDLAQAHWEKLVWNIPFNGLGVASVLGYETFAADPFRFNEGRLLEPCLATDKLLRDKGWTRIVRELMLEVIAVGRAHRFDIPDSLADYQIERTRAMGGYKASTVLDFEHGLPMELDALFLEPLRQAKKMKVSVPRLERLCEALALLDPARMEKP